MRIKSNKTVDANGSTVSKQINYKRNEYKNLLRAEAKARDAQRNSRTPKQQLAKLDAGNHTATREHARLNMQIRGQS